eukprot:scaffold1737_cov131-Skeletonema_menzelii.AAC.1
MMTMESSSGMVLSSGDMSQKGSNRPIVRRRRNVKGLIAGESRSSATSAGSGDTKNARPEETNASKPSAAHHQKTPNNANSANLSADPPSINSLPHPCCSARLALSCVENALQMGVVTKFFLCPQGRARKSLLGQARLNKGHHSPAEEQFIMNPASQHDVDDGFSSGDDDDFDKSIQQDAQNPNNKNKAMHIINARNREPFFVPTGPDASSIGMQGGKVPGAGGGKLPFNYKKIRYFDAVTANDRAVARNFLRQEINAANKSYSKALVNHLKNNEQNNNTHAPNDKNNDPIHEQKAALKNSLTRFPHELKPELSAALVIESLSINPHESIEGMAKCYDGIVSAGIALLDIANDTAIDGTGTGGSNKAKLTTAEIMTALTPLLVTTLEQPSGEVFIVLAKLRNYCGTRRYQRRFVQRIAPFLVRPPDAAIWCLRHQGDIEAIIAAIEMILDNAFDVFSSGWFERGRNILKDTHRAESLCTAASQLRRLNSPSPTGGLLVGLSTPGLHRRGGQASAGFGSIGAKRDGVSSDSLEEWEVLAIDDHIRHSVMDLFSRDWSRISTLSNSMKEHDTPYGRRRGISASKSKEWQDATTAGSSSLSNFGLTKSPRTINNSKLPLSPRNATLSGGQLSTPTAQLPSADALESTFGPSFSSQHVVIENSDPPPPPSHFSPPPAPSSPTRESPSKLGTPKTPPSHFHEFRSTDRLSMPNLQEQRSSSQSIATEPSSPGSRSREMGSVPLSPQSSLGASSAGVGGQRPASLTPSIMKDQYRALTSTAAERKRTVAACRALRAQITQFEDAFIKNYGRAPKGFSERAPLASTYTQYREWKRAIRADAACRIQALFRGAKARLTLRHSHNEKIARFVSKRFKTPTTSHGAQGRKIDQSLNHLSIPLDIGRSDTDSPLPRTRLETRTGQRGDDSVEVVMNSGASNSTGGTSPTPSSSPNWRNRSQRRQQQSGGGTSRSSSGRRSSSSSLPDVTVMSLAELQQRKRELKQQLKQYDMNFHAQHGRMPEKREKEPIRHLYESYNTYKNQISTIEKGEAQPGPGTAAFRGADVSPSNSPSASPTFNSGSVTPPQGDSHFKKATDLSEESSKSEDDVESGTGSSSQDLASLKAEKATLHQMLRSYEKDFFKEHKRQVSSFADIRPVAGQYRRYKEIKKAIASLS